MLVGGFFTPPAHRGAGDIGALSRSSYSPRPITPRNSLQAALATPISLPPQALRRRRNGASATCDHFTFRFGEIDMDVDGTQYVGAGDPIEVFTAGRTFVISIARYRSAACAIVSNWRLLSGLRSWRLKAQPRQSGGPLPSVPHAIFPHIGKVYGRSHYKILCAGSSDWNSLGCSIVFGADPCQKSRLLMQ